MSRRPLILAGLALAACGALPGAAAAQRGDLGLTELTGQKFPQRGYILTLPRKVELTAADVAVTENGVTVAPVKVRPTAADGTPVVLAIDASNSMRGQAIEDAMAGARAFARRRRPDQKLGVVFFSRTPTVALAPTTDAERIDAVLAAPPELSGGTRIYDAAKASLDLLREADAGPGAVVLLSDGADGGSVVAPADIEAGLRRSGDRIHSIALRSASFDAEALRRVAARGSYLEATSSERLARVYGTLGDRLSNEYIVSYRSEAPLDSRVAVTMAVDDMRAAVAYETPSLDLKVGDPRRATDSPWVKPVAAGALAVGLAGALGLVLLLLVYPRRGSVRDRVEAFVPEAGPAAGPDRRHPELELGRILRALDERLSGLKRWRAFKLEVELTGLKSQPARLISAAVVVGLALGFAVGVVLGSPLLGLVLLAAPVVALKVFVHTRTERVRRRFADQLPDNLQVLASALRAGHSFIGALKVVAADAGEPSKAEFKRVVADDQLGVSVEDSFSSVGERMKNPDVSYVGLIATIQRETGGNTAEVLDRVTGTIRERAQLRRFVRTLTAQGRLGGWIVTALPVGMVVFLNIVRPGYIDPLLEEPLGVMALCIGAVALTTGALIIRKIVDIKV